MEKLSGELDLLTYESIPGADHSYTHQRPYVWNVVSRWLEKCLTWNWLDNLPEPGEL